MDKLFLDANILFTATYSGTGASRALFELAKKKKMILTSSKYAIVEAQRNILLKLGENQLPVFYKLIAELKSIEKKNFSKEEIQIYKDVINPKDAPILMAAKEQNAQFLITLDKKDFKTPKLEKAQLSFVIMSPGEYLQRL